LIVIAGIWHRKARYLNQKKSLITFGGLSKQHAICIEEIGVEHLILYVLGEIIHKSEQNIQNQLYWDARLWIVQQRIQWDEMIKIIQPKMNGHIVFIMFDFEVLDKTRERLLIAPANSYKSFCYLLLICSKKKNQKGLKNVI